MIIVVLIVLKEIFFMDSTHYVR